MLKKIYIKNFTLIDQLDITFHAGFSVITGETGAGKSIILGAIGLLLGNRADSKMIKMGEKKCTIEAHFDLSKYNYEAYFEELDIDFEPEDTIIRRELTSNGKSRAFINDTPVSLQDMRTLGEQLIDIHSQHQNLLLQKEDFQLNVIDTIASDQKEVAAYKAAFQQYKNAEKQLAELTSRLAKAKENEDFLRFQYNELASANLVSGEQEELEQESKMLSHAEEIKSALYQANGLLSDDNAIIDQLRTVSEILNKVTSVYPKIEAAAARVDEAYIELKDIASEVSAESENIDYDPTHLEEVNQKLDTLFTLEQKYHVSSDTQLIALKNELDEQLQKIDNSDEETAELERVVGRWKAEAEKLGKTLTTVRKKAAKTIENEMGKRLVPLGIPKVQFKVEIAEKTLSLDGRDKVQFLFSANTSTALEPIAQVASGGEIARVMLSLKAMLSGAVKLPTIIFDEIDTGVSGKIAEKMALIMKEMGNADRQVLSITHLPQIAALGHSHYKVEKEEAEDGTHSRMRELSDEERVQEIAQMLSGADITEAALQNARELIKQSK
ncbi:MAG: DNA repair protein RecN [Prevotella bivia]|uniref:DNA repair protein RecN n=1 Tax=Prevotella bivia TaxID=28125 RepID=UPI00050F73AE|nr:DNA repair protein RecN [Prevotella bivia]KGF37993.1 DNA recombination protein RecN [Prevotella bivia DNF00650]MBS6328569.1 DNA repair protein RecN [Prevotella bivia]MDU2114424.1 DNA repair protein RecN [Prevotella bivia]MDU3909461.1 DNA repair protein RecN [Prevotella bivia]MDU5343215.1 DNA repair protein RecN [Prevotella bivia]